MDKRYYSAKHKRNNRKKDCTLHKNKGSREEKGTFMLRVNMCLGIAIIAVGIYRLGNDFSQGMTDSVMYVLSESTSAESIKNTAASVFNFISEGRSIGVLAGGRESVTLDEETLEYIKQNENAYYNNQNP